MIWEWKDNMKKLLVIMFSISLLACGVSQQDYDSVVAERDTLNEKVADLEVQLTSAKNKYSNLERDFAKYKEEMAKYEKLSEAEFEAAEAEATAKKLKAAEEARVIREEQEARKAEEAAAKAAAAEAEKAQKEAEEKMGYETGITYDQLARTPDDYIGKKVKFYGRVVQVLEGTTNHIRLAVNDNYDTIAFLEYDPKLVSSRILEDDFITIYGVSYGLHTYTSTMNASITIPAIVVDKIDQ